MSEPQQWPDNWPDWRTAYAQCPALSAADLIEAGEVVAANNLDIDFDAFTQTAEVYRRGYAALAKSLARNVEFFARHVISGSSR